MTLLLLLGCGGVGLDGAPGGDPVAAAVTLTGIDPGWGPPDADTPVTLTGTGFEGELTAWFGDAEVAVTRLDDTRVVTTAPAAGVEATVDVTLRSELGEATLAGGFTYADSPPPDTGDTGGGGGGGGGGGAGKTGGLLQFSLLQVACPSCLGYTDDLFVEATLGLHDPVAAGWLDWVPAEGTCAVDPVSDAPASTFLDAGEWAWLTSGSVSVGLRQADGVYAASGLDEGDFVRNAGYDLALSEGGGDLGAFSVEDALTTPQAISELEPYDMLYTTPQSAFAARVRASNATFTWGPVGGGGSFAVILDIYSPQGAFLAEVVCLGPDTGRLTVPSAYLSGYPDSALLVIGMYRWAEGSFERPDDGSTVETLTTFGVLGTGVLLR